MSRRWRLHDADPATWPAFDASALPEVQWEVFAARRCAVVVRSKVANPPYSAFISQSIT